MAKLPSAADFSTGLPSARGANSVQAVRAQEMRPNLEPAHILMDVGATLGKEAQSMRALAKQEEQKLDALKAEEALNKIRQARLDLTMGEKGAYAVKGGGVLDTQYATGYKERLATVSAGVMAALSPAQQARLKPHADNEMLGFQSDVLRHSMTEAERYKGLVRQGSLDTATSVGVEQWNDPMAFNKSLADLDTVVMGMAKEQGITGQTDAEKDTLMSMRRKAMSPMFVGAITKALDAKTPDALARAEELFKSGGQAIDANARLQIGAHIQKARDILAVQTDAQDFMSSVIAPAQQPASKFASALAASIDVGESGKNGQHVVNGQVLLGPVITAGGNKGQRAVGKHQIMPDSAKQDAREAGLPWDEKLFYSPTPEGAKYHDALQAAHIDRLAKMFDSPAEIAAAYNAGEGNVIKAKAAFDKYQKMAALAKSDPSIVPMAPASYNRAKDGPISFLDFLPKPSETKPYVSKVMSAYAATPDIVKPTTRDIEATMQAKYPGRPDLAADATKLVKHQLATIEDARKEEIETSKEQAYKLMAQGKMFSDLPTSLVSKLPVRDADEVRGVFDAHISKTPRDSNQGLLTNINSDPNYLARLPNSAWNGPMRTQLSEYDWARFDKQRSARLGGEVKETDNLDSGAVHGLLTTRLAMLDIAPKASDKKGQAVVNSARAVLDQSVLDRQQQLGRKMTDVELRQHIDGMFATSAELKSTFNFITGGTTKKSVMAMAYADIPSEDRTKIEASLRSRGVTSPTDVQILTVYKQAKQGLL